MLSRITRRTNSCENGLGQRNVTDVQYKDVLTARNELYFQGSYGIIILYRRLTNY